MAVGTYGKGLPQSGPMNYNDWVMYHQRAGTKLPTGTALRDRYQSYAAAHAPKSAAPTPAPAAPPAAVQPVAEAGPVAQAKPQFQWDYGALDDVGQRTIADAVLARDQNKARINESYDLTMRNNAAQRLLAQQAQDEGNVSVDRNAAARGIFNSGIKQFNRGKVAASFMRAAQQIGLADTAAEIARSRGYADADAAYRSVDGDARASSAARAWQKYLELYGGL